MSLHVLTLEEKLAVVEIAIRAVRKKARIDPTHKANFEALKSVAADLRARMGLPQSNALDKLRRALESAKSSKTALGYEQSKLIAVANVVIHEWPTIQQALEQFEEHEE